MLEQDNAFYMRVTNDEQAFFIINHQLFQWIPMSLNGGIITHEYTHYVFDTFVLGIVSLARLAAWVDVVMLVLDGCRLGESLVVPFSALLSMLSTIQSSACIRAHAAALSIA